MPLSSNQHKSRSKKSEKHRDGDAQTHSPLQLQMSSLLSALQSFSFFSGGRDNPLPSPFCHFVSFTFGGLKREGERAWEEMNCLTESRASGKVKGGEDGRRSLISIGKLVGN